MSGSGRAALLVCSSANVEVVDKFEVERLRCWVVYVCGCVWVDD